MKLTTTLAVQLNNLRQTIHNLKNTWPSGMRDHDNEIDIKRERLEGLLKYKLNKIKER